MIYQHTIAYFDLLGFELKSLSTFLHTTLSRWHISVDESGHIRTRELDHYLKELGIPVNKLESFLKGLGLPIDKLESFLKGSIADIEKEGKSFGEKVKKWFNQ